MASTLFIGCSSEGLDAAYAAQANLERDCEVTVWDQDVFGPSSYTMESLLKAAESSDFALLIFTPDDLTKLRGTTVATARDNVVLELGLFIGRLGRERTFLMIPRDVRDFRLPTDLLGLTPITYAAERNDKNWQAALGPACNQIRRAIRALGSRERRSKGTPSGDLSTVCHSFNAYLAALRQEFTQIDTELWILTHEREWVFPLFPSILQARLANKRVNIVYQRPAGTEWPSYRFSLLAAMGCGIAVLGASEPLPFRGFAANYQLYDRSVVCTRTPDSEADGVFARLFRGPFDYEIAKLISTFLPPYRPRLKSATGTPSIERASAEPTISRLRDRVHLYKNAHFSLERVQVASVLPLERTLRDFKIRQAVEQVALYQSNGFEPFEWLTVRLPTGTESSMLPPLLEERDGNLVVINGHSRLMACKQLGILDPLVLVVRGVKADLPTQPTSWSQVTISPGAVSAEEKWGALATPLIRRIENSVRRDIELPFSFEAPEP